MIVYGDWVIRAGGAVYRLSLYDCCLVTSLIFPSTYSYRKMKIIDGPWPMGQGAGGILDCYWAIFEWRFTDAKIQ